MQVSYLRLILFLMIVGCCIALLGWLISSFLNLYITLAVESLWLAWILTGIFIILLIIFLVASVRYLFIFTRPEIPSKPQQQLPTPLQSPLEKLAATQKNLNQIQQKALEIEDEIMRQSLLEKSAALATHLSSPTLRIVVFGTGSAGKTSLVNALLQKNVGEVGVTLGTTTETRVYQWNLPGISYPVEVLDCPGILEIGSQGVEREKEARSQAQAADLVLIVTDGDLRQTEFRPLQELIRLGKRTLLILNKADLYTKAEQQELITCLQRRVKDLIPPEDIFLTAASPAKVVIGSEIWQPEPQVDPIRQRIQMILYTEASELTVDNALIQSRDLAEEVRQVIQSQLSKQAEAVVERFQWIVTGIVFVNPIPALDLLAIAAINAQMVVEIGGIYGCKMNLKQGRELAYSLAKTLASLGLVEGAIQVTTGILSSIVEFSVLGFLVTSPIQALSAGYLTHLAGRSFITYFQNNQTWGEEGVQSVIQTQATQLNQSLWIRAYLREGWERLRHLIKQQ
jgi:small GTP-binding protein